MLMNFFGNSCSLASSSLPRTLLSLIAVGHRVGWNRQPHLRGCQWNLTKSIWEMRLSRGLLCIRFRNLTNSNQCQIINFSSKNQSRASFWWFDKLQLFAVFEIWHIRSDFGSNLVKFWKRRTKMTHVMIFLFDVLKIWQISSQNRSECVKFQKRRTIEVCQILKTKHVIDFSKRN